MNNTFRDLVGNESLKKLLSTHILAKTLSHAYIIEGPAGSGKKTIAKEISKALCCDAPRPVLPCNECRSCRRINSGLNTDIIYVNSGERASILVEDIREMTSTLGYYPDDGDVKIYIIEEAEKMTTQAQNALLLSLEEPPSYVVFLLLTEDSASLLETIRSRAQTLKTEIFDTKFVSEWLKNHPEAKKAKETDITAAAMSSRGALGKALQILKIKKSADKSIDKQAYDFIRLLCNGNKGEAILFASALKYTRAEYEQFFDSAIFVLHTLLEIKYSKNTNSDFDETDEMCVLSSRLKISKLLKLYDSLILAKEDICEKNASTYAVMTTLAADAVS